MYSFIFKVGIRNHNKKKYAMRYTGYTTPFIVLLLVTDDPEDWHRENLERNPAHYSALLRAWTAAGGNAPRALACLQMDSGARIFFNTLVPFEDGLIKYGVIATKDLIADLLGRVVRLFLIEYLCFYSYHISKILSRIYINF